MLTGAFDRLLPNLVGAFLHYQEVPRTPDAIAELGGSRWDLELARNAIAVERERIAAHPTRPVATLRTTATSDDDLARLRVCLDGLSR